MATYKYLIFKDKTLIKEFTGQTSDSAVYGFLLRIQGQSVSYALKFGGYEVEVINEQTLEKENYGDN